MLGHAAQQLARRGLAVFPCLVGAKEPATANGLHAATTDASIIAAWWRQQPSYNIGCATGAVSQIFVLDIDSTDAEAELKKLEAENSALPATVEAITGKGRHLYFKMPDCDLRNSASKLAPGLDIRANGGYVLVPPSLHPSGKKYAWSVDSAETFAPPPQWLIEKVATPSGANGKEAMSAAALRALFDSEIVEGKRNVTLTRIVGHLLRRRVDPLVVVEIATAINAARCAPPLPLDEVATICDSIAARELKRRLA
jgi:hypothetical protein